MIILAILSTLAIAAIVAADQLVKLWAVNELAAVGTKEFIPGFIRFAYLENDGAAFGILADHRWVFIAVTIIMVAVAMFLLYSGRLRKPLQYIPAICIIGGGIGNLIDRIGKGYVVDMFDFEFMDFAVFNVADIFVCLGAGLVILYLIVDEIQLHRAAASGKEEARGGTDDTDGIDGAAETPEASGITSDSRDEDKPVEQDD